MKLKAGISAICLLALGCAFAAVPAFADPEYSVIYDNSGPGSYTTNAWSIFGSGVGAYTATNSFTLYGGEGIDGANFYAWFYPGDSLTSVDWSISSTAFGTPIASGTSVAGPNTQVATAFGYYSVLEETILIPFVSLPAGTYWLQLSNAQDAYDTSVWWDESDGSSTAYESGSLAPIPSETFQILATPEPSSFLLMGLGMLALAGLATRGKLLA